MTDEPNTDRAIGRLEGKVDLILSHLDGEAKARAAAAAEQRASDAKRDARISSLERKDAWRAGFAAALGGVAGYVASILKGVA